MPVEKVHLIAAARPNFMKVAPLWHALRAAPDFAPVLVHTGQHYDAAMSDEILHDLGLPEPDFHLGVGSGGHGAQTGRVMIEYEKVALIGRRPDWLIVVGDVNSTVAAALVGVKLGIATVHLEAGLRSRDRTMPEEINRIATDAISDLLWTPSPDADANLAAEGIPSARISRVGNIMLDSFEAQRPAIEAAGTAEALGLAPPYGVATLHRPSNVDDPEQLRALADAMIAAQRLLPLVFPLHPRTAARLAETGERARLEAAGVRLIAPLPYVRFMSLVTGAAAVITDSGGLQEETTYLGIPCLTLRENTERPITLSEGTNRLATAASLPAMLGEALAAGRAAPKRPRLWDGKTAERCLADLRRRSKRAIRAAAA